MTSLDKSDNSSPLQLQLLTSQCGAGTCPTIYKTNRGTLVVQGYTISALAAGLDLPEGEQLVEIPVDLLTGASEAVS